MRSRTTTILMCLVLLLGQSCYTRPTLYENRRIAKPADRDTAAQASREVMGATRLDVVECYEDLGQAERVIEYPAHLFSHPIALQLVLHSLGYNPGPVDGVIGSRTKLAIVLFQSRQGLTIDGMAGPITREAIAGQLNKAGPQRKKTFTQLLQVASQRNRRLENLLPSDLSRTWADSSRISIPEGYTVDYKGRIVPKVAENRSYYGEVSKSTGRPKTVYVKGYYRKDGTYVRGHYRSKPRR